MKRKVGKGEKRKREIERERESGCAGDKIPRGKLLVEKTAAVGGEEGKGGDTATG